MEVGGLMGEVTTLKAEFAVLKTNQQVQPPLIRRHYRRRATVPQPLEAGAVDPGQPREPIRKRRKVTRGVAASVSGAAESAPQPPPECTTTTAGIDAILATLNIIIAGMVQMSAVRQGEVAQLLAVLQPHATDDGAKEQDQPRASDFEVF